MAKKFTPTSPVKYTAERYGQTVISNKKRQKKALKNKSELPTTRQLNIDQAQSENDSARSAVLSSMEFAVKAGSSTNKIARAYYAGALKGTAKGIINNLRNK
jgi:hypothetical protein